MFNELLIEIPMMAKIDRYNEGAETYDRNLDMVGFMCTANSSDMSILTIFNGQRELLESSKSALQGSPAVSKKPSEMYTNVGYLRTFSLAVSKNSVCGWRLPCLFTSPPESHSSSVLELYYCVQHLG